MRDSSVRIFVGGGIAALGFFIEVALVTPLQAQTAIDAAKITCEELKRIPVILKHSLHGRNSWRILED
jgi:hypothetical protein